MLDLKSLLIDASLSIPDAARTAGVSPEYAAGWCRGYLGHNDRVVELPTVGTTTGQEMTVRIQEFGAGKLAGERQRRAEIEEEPTAVVARTEAADLGEGD